jgi:hypothetical protein
MISRDEASGCLPGLPEGITAQKGKGHSKNIRFPLEAENARLKARIAELEGDLQTVFINVAETFEAVATTLKDQAILRGRELSEFMEPARKAAKAGDSIRLLAFTRQATSKLRKALQNIPATSIKTVADPGKPVLVAVSKVELRSLQIKERIEESGSKVFSSRDARQYIAGKEGEEPSRRDTIRALKRTVKLLPRYVLEVTGNLSRLICRDVRSDIEITISEKEEKRSLWQRQGLTIALPWLDPQGLQANVGRT